MRIAARDANVDVVACPAVLYECLRVKQPKLRKARMRAITRQAWSRPMPEAFWKPRICERRLPRSRPHWLTPAPTWADGGSCEVIGSREPAARQDPDGVYGACDR